MADSSTNSPSSPLQEIIVTLPRPLVVALAMLLVLTLGGAGWVAATAAAESLRDLAKSVLLVVLPMSVVVAAAIGVRRTSTTQVDQLVTAFLEQTVAARFALACEQRGSHPFPFSRADLVTGTLGRSYVEFKLTWDKRAEAPARVWVKMNVVNFEVAVEQRLRWPVPLADDATLPHGLFDAKSLDDVFAHPLMRHLAMTVQGSVEEGYKVRALFRREAGGTVLARLSFRQKLREHFLASPFLKRYYAEDAVILVGVLFGEMADNQLLPLSHLGEEG
jgi:hypothetical protein